MVTQTPRQYLDPTLLYNGGPLGTPVSGTLTNTTGLPIGGISATGTPSSTTYLRGDGSWSSPATGTTIPIIIIEQQLTSGTAGGSSSSATWNPRILNTIVINDVGSGVSVNTSTGVVTLPAGTYKYRGRSSVFYVGRNRLRLQNTTSSTTLGVGLNSVTDTNSGSNGEGEVAQIEGRFAITGSTNVQLQHYTANAYATSALGLAESLSGINEVYGQLVLEKVA